MKLFETSIQTKRGNSSILVGDGILRSIGAIAAQKVKGRRACVVTDGNVCNLHLVPVLESLRAAENWRNRRDWFPARSGRRKSSAPIRLQWCWP